MRAIPKEAGEHWLGWGWAEQAAHSCQVDLVTTPKARADVEENSRAAVKTLNELLKKAGQSPGALEEVIRDASKSGDKKLFNSAAQAWNHSFFWAAMSPMRERPQGDLDAAIKASFGDVAALRTAFVAEGAGHFGWGWVWLVGSARRPENTLDP